jgi:hypothetical protein
MGSPVKFEIEPPSATKFEIEPPKQQRPGFLSNFGGVFGLPHPIEQVKTDVEGIKQGGTGYVADQVKGAIKNLNPLPAMSETADSAAKLWNTSAPDESFPQTLNRKAGAVLRFAEAGVPFIGPGLAHAADQLNEGDIRGGAGTTAGIAAGLFGPKAGEGVNAVRASTANWLRNSSYDTMNSVLGTKGKNMAYERNPGRGVVQEGIMGLSRPSILDKIEKVIPQRSAQIDEVLQRPQYQGIRLNIAPDVNEPFNSAFSSGIKGTAPTDFLNRLRSTQRDLTQERGVNPESGDVEFSGQPKKLFDLSPYEANLFKRDVGENTKFNNIAYDEPINNVKRTVYGNVKGRVNEAVPQVEPFNERVSDLMGARDALSGMINRRLVSPKSGISDIAPAVIGTAAEGPVGGAALVLGKEVLGSPGVRSLFAQGKYRAANFLSPKTAPGPLTVPPDTYMPGQFSGWTPRALPPGQYESPESGMEAFGRGIIDRANAVRPRQLPPGQYEQPASLFGPQKLLPASNGTIELPESTLGTETQVFNAPARMVRDPRTGKMRRMYVTGRE